MKNQLGMAVIGCGQIAQAHLKAIDQIKSAQLIVTVDSIEERAIAAQNEFNARRYYTDTEEALADVDIDAVILTLPHHLHKPIAIQGARAGKHRGDGHNAVDPGNPTVTLHHEKLLGLDTTVL